MRTCSIVLAFLAVAVVASAKPIRPETGAPNTLDGVWVSVSLDVGLDRGPRNEQLKMTFAGTKLTLESSNDPAKKQATFVADFSKKPGHLDFTPTDGPFNGQKVAGIFSRDGDTLKICAGNQPGGARPAEFKAGEGNAVIVLKLQK